MNNEIDLGEAQVSVPNTFEQDIQLQNQNKTQQIDPQMFKNGIDDVKQINKFNYLLRDSKSIQQQIANVDTLLQSPQHVIDKFTESKGIKSIHYYINKSIQRIDAKKFTQEDLSLAEKTLKLCARITFNVKLLKYSQISDLFKTIRQNENLPDDIQRQVYILLQKWSEVIEEYENDKEEQDTNNQYQSFQLQNFKQQQPAQIIKQNQNNQKKYQQYQEKNESNNDKQDNNSKNYIKQSVYDKKKKSEHKGYFDENESDFSGKSKKSDSRKSKNQKYQKNSSSSKKKKKHHGQSISRSRSRSKSQNKDFNKQVQPLPQKKNVRFKFDDNRLFQIKYYRINDEPNARGLTQEEVQEIQQKMIEEQKQNPLNYNAEDFKLMDSKMESRNMKMIKENERELLEKINQVREQISWYRPQRIGLSDDLYEYQLGTESKEKTEHTKRIANKLNAYYVTDTLIPLEPKYEQQLLAQQNQTEQKQTINVSILRFSQKESSEMELENEEQKINPSNSTETIEQNQVEDIEIHPYINNSKQISSILKKSKEQLKKEREEAKEREREIKRKKKEEILRKEREQKEKKEQAEKLIKTITEIFGKSQKSGGQLSQEEKELFSVSIKSLQNINPELGQKVLQNIKTYQDKKDAEMKEKQKLIEQSQIKPISTIPSMNLLNQPQQQLNRPSQINRVPEVSKSQPQFIPNLQQIANPIPQSTFGNPSFQQQNQPLVSQQLKESVPQLQFGKNYKVIPCKNFHSSTGCIKGDNCTYKHDPKFQGAQIPGFEKFTNIQGKDLIKKGEAGQSLGNEFLQKQGPIQGNLPPNFGVLGKPPNAQILPFNPQMARMPQGNLQFYAPVQQQNMFQYNQFPGQQFNHQQFMPPFPQFHPQQQQQQQLFQKQKNLPFQPNYQAPSLNINNNFTHFNSGNAVSISEGDAGNNEENKNVQKS